ncbi:MAG: 23S rRNA (guanosine(2251)-2'-O)-methyltransferase RlmB [Lachnospiraceae bacterium]|nr:23S rRNA (guanosine(2251)-2'-O)-methyltransferase RlmB [Lachnospiraceae bacterium]
MSRDQADIIEGRNEIIEAFRAGRTIDRIIMLDGSNDGPLQAVKERARKKSIRIDYVPRKRLDEISPTGRHQGVIAYAAAYHYSTVEDILERAQRKGEDPFIILLDNIEDPHNLGAIIRTANAAGAHGVIIPKNRAVGLTSTVVRCSSGAVNYTPVAKVANLARTIEDLKKKGLWFVCADMSGDDLHSQKLTGPIGLVIGSEGSGVGQLVKSKCDFLSAIPMMGEIDSLNSSVAAGVMAYEILRQRRLDK